MGGSKSYLSHRNMVKSFLVLKSVKIVKEYMQHRCQFELIERFVSEKLNEYKSKIPLIDGIRLSMNIEEKRTMLDFVYSNWKFIYIDESIAYEYIQSINMLYTEIYRNVDIKLCKMNDLPKSINGIWSYLNCLNVDIYCKENVMMFNKVEFIEIEITDRSLVAFCGNKEYIKKYIQDAVYFLYPTSVIIAVEFKDIIKVLLCDGVFEKSILDRYDKSLLTELIMICSSLMINNKMVNSMVGD